MPRPSKKHDAVPRHPALADFDERLWPVNLVLLVLAGFIAGIIFAKSDFQTPVLIHNGYCHLVTLAAIVGVLAWGSIRLDGRLQRRLQFGVAMSLLVHFWLCLLSYNVYLSLSPVAERDSPEQFEEPQIVTLPDYHWQDQQQVMVDETLESPVETDTPENTAQPIEQAETEPTPIKRPSEAEPAVQQREPSEVELERAEMTTPRRAERMAGERISRRETSAPTPIEQVETPQLSDAAKPSPQMAPQVEAVEHQATAAQIERRQASEQPAARARPDAAQMARRQNAPQPTRPATDSASVAKQMTRPTPLEPARIESREPPAAQQARATPLAPAPGEVARQSTTPALTRAPTTAAAESPRATAANANPRRHAANDRPELDRIAAAARSRSNAEASAANAAPPSMTAPAPASSASGEAAPLEPAMANVARSAASAPAIERRAEMAEPTASRGASASIAAGAPQRAAASGAGEPTVAPNAPRFARANSAPSLAGEAMAPVEAPSAASQSQPNSAATQPAATGLTKASGGAPGRTRQRNFDRDLPGEGQLVRTPSAAARRAAASQRMEPGAAASPSEPAQIAKARAGQSTASAALPAEDVAAADAAGARQPSRIEASASAAMSRDAANAPRGRVTAAAGNASLDLGPTQIVSAMGEGRTSGGGEPTLGDLRNPTRIAKAAGSAAGGAAAQAEAAMPAAPNATAANSVGGSAGSAASPAVGALARGEQSLPAGRPTRSSSTNSATQAASGGSAAALAPNALGEARRVEDANSAMAGGGAGAAAGALTRARGAAALPADNATIETADAMAGQGAVGGGSSAPGQPARGGLEAATDSGAARQVASLPINPSLPGGANAGEAAGASAGSFSPAGPGAPRRAEGGAEMIAPPTSGAEIAGVLSRGAPAMPAGSAEVDAAALADVSPSDAAPGGDPLAPAGNLPAGRMAAAGLPVQIAAPAGPGGLSNTPAPEIGLPSRRARAESEVVHTAASRMILERSGSKLAADVRVRDTAVPGLRQRDRAMRRELARQRGGSEGSERAVEMGLDFLARHQNPDGSWSLHDFSQGQPGYENAGYGRMQSDTAATGLSMLAFLGAGYTHTDGKYRLVVGRGLSFLLGNQRADGDLFVPQDARSNLNVWLYSHGIAAIALCEAYGMTRDPNLQQPAQRALDFIVAAQNPTEGGWRYSPRQGSDTSVSGWQLMALKSGELAGLQAPAETYARVQTWLDGAQGQANPSLYVYRPKAKQDHQRLPSRVMTAEALLMRQYLGWKRDNPTMVAGADYLLGHLPQWTASGAERDAYYWYYATQFMFQMGGGHWQQWNERLRPLLIDNQETAGPLAGSWDPLGQSPDRWGREAGRLYTTAMHLLMLEVYYRHLPLYRNLEGEEAGADLR